MIGYKFIVKDIYSNERREFELLLDLTDPRPVHKKGMEQIKYEEDIEKLYRDTPSKRDIKYDKLVYDKRKGFLD